MIKLDKISNNELVEQINKSVGVLAFGVYRSAYLSALEKQFIKRNIDVSEIGNEKTFSFARKVHLEEGRLIPIDND